MIFIINVIALYASFSTNSMYGVFWGAILPALYAIVVAPHALIGRTDMPPTKIKKILAGRWENADDLTGYIVKYWMALASPATSWKKQLNSVILYVTSFFLGFVYFLREMFAGAILLFGVGYILYKMSRRVDRPRAVYANSDFRDGSDNEFARKEWELAAMAIVAFSDLYPDDSAIKNSANEVSEDEEVKLLLAKYRHDQGLGWVA
ncbi:hypothetical protein SAMN05216386_0177 [Nitrosospira briensis]|uniref:Uncharacterized protein n=1 Tax=Nitrosospira briensis TaxID=35799 RepID=A0A1I4XLB7_9PROT|nr:hypothetical protein [Nitrosospira briensis]SFN26263.1 hypothetical protein SAMN05216386_0177 [Nitrosospira briensis]